MGVVAGEESVGLGAALRPGSGQESGEEVEDVVIAEAGVEVANGKPDGRVMPGGCVMGMDGAAGLAEDERASCWARRRAARRCCDAS